MAEDQYARYDYAWKTPGWTTQNPVVTYATDGYVDPGMPSDVSLVRVYGSFMEMDTGRGLEGVLRIRVRETLTHVPTGQVVPAGAVKLVRFRRDGFSLYLPATDDPDLTPAFTYEARLTVRGETKEFTFSLPSVPTEVNIMELVPSTDAAVDPNIIDGGTP